MEEKKKGHDWIYFWHPEMGHTRYRFNILGNTTCGCCNDINQTTIAVREYLRYPGYFLFYCEACFVRRGDILIPLMPSEAQGW